MQIYSPAEDSFLMLENMEIPKGSRVLDMGTGSGILAVEAAKFAKEVVAADINHDAVEELKNQGIPNIVPVHTDLFKNIEGGFDLILFNAPYLPGEEDTIWSGGEKGRAIIENFLKKAMGIFPREMKGPLRNYKCSQSQDQVLACQEGWGMPGDFLFH